MATVKLTIFKAGSVAGGGRQDIPSVFNASAVRRTLTLTSSASNKLFSAAADVSEATGDNLNAGETAYLTSNGGAVKVAVAVGENPDATVVYQFIAYDTQGFLPLYASKNDTRIAIVDA